MEVVVLVVFRARGSLLPLATLRNGGYAILTRTTIDELSRGSNVKQFIISLDHRPSLSDLSS